MRHNVNNQIRETDTCVGQKPVNFWRFVRTRYNTIYRKSRLTKNIFPPAKRFTLWHLQIIPRVQRTLCQNLEKLPQIRNYNHCQPTICLYSVRNYNYMHVEYHHILSIVGWISAIMTSWPWWRLIDSRMVCQRAICSQPNPIYFHGYLALNSVSSSHADKILNIELVIIR